MPELTFVIPCAPYHRSLVQNAINSIQAQTIPCQYLVIEDTAGHGAGWARNQGLQQVTTPFVSFLDADDTIEPDFAELCFAILARVTGSRYIYTNWYEDEAAKVAPSPCEVWTQQTYHIVTTVMRTADVRRIGGYDETMPGAEDTDFGIRLKLSGVCGVHLNKALVHYRKGGQRSIHLRASGQEAEMLAYMTQRYGGYTMGCCGDNTPSQNAPTGAKRDGDVLALAMWNGNRQERGLATGRIYPRTGNGKAVWVDPADIAAAPHMWKKTTIEAVEAQIAPVVLMPGYQAQGANWRTAGDAAFGGGQPAASQPAAPQNWNYQPVENSRSIRDTLKIGQKKTE